MKKTILIGAVLALICAGAVFAQEGRAAYTAAAGVGPEWNMNSREDFAMGAVLGFDINLPGMFAAGLTAAYSNNFSGIQVIEPAALFRWYFLPNDHTGLFVQADLGAYLILEDGEIEPMFLGGLRAGIRLPLGAMFYAEPYGRVGYPFMFGIGALAGVRF